MPERIQDNNVRDEDLVSSPNKRWEYTGTILASLVIMSLPIVIVGAGLGALSLGVVSQGWFALYSIITLMAATWVFGKETLEAVQKARGNE